MPLDQNVLDEILDLMAKQVLAELRKSVAAGETIDPRRIKNAMDLLERADARAFKPTEAPVLLKKGKTVEVTGTDETDDDSVPVEVPDIYRTKAMRDRFRAGLVAFLSKRDRLILNSFAQEDSADLIPEPTTTKGATT